MLRLGSQGYAESGLRSSQGGSGAGSPARWRQPRAEDGAASPPGQAPLMPTWAQLEPQPRNWGAVQGAEEAPTLFWDAIAITATASQHAQVTVAWRVVLLETALAVLSLVTEVLISLIFPGLQENGGEFDLLCFHGDICDATLLLHPRRRGPSRPVHSGPARPSGPGSRSRRGRSAVLGSMGLHGALSWQKEKAPSFRTSFPMLPSKGSVSERHSLSLHPIAKGMRVLQSVATRDSHDPEGKQWGGLHRSAQVIKRYYSKMNELKDIPSPTGFVSKMEELRKVFLMRPGCPQFSTKATSMSYLGKSHASATCHPEALSSGWDFHGALGPGPAFRGAPGATPHTGAQRELQQRRVEQGKEMVGAPRSFRKEALKAYNGPPGPGPHRPDEKRRPWGPSVPGLRSRGSPSRSVHRTLPLLYSGSSRRQQEVGTRAFVQATSEYVLGLWALKTEICPISASAVAGVTGACHYVPPCSVLRDNGHDSLLGMRALSSHMWHFASTGSDSMVTLPMVVCASSPAWRGAEEPLPDTRGSNMNEDGPPLKFSRSACELGYRQREAEGPSLSRSLSFIPTAFLVTPKRRLPWYISVIHEKDHSLFMMGKKIQRLAELEAQVQRKDQEIQVLRREREVLKKQLKSLLRSRSQELPMAFLNRVSRRPRAEWSVGQLGVLKNIYKDEEEMRHWIQMQEAFATMEPAQEQQLELGSVEEEKGLEEPAQASAKGGAGRAGVPVYKDAEARTEEEEQQEAQPQEEEGEEEEEEEEEDRGGWELREEDEHPVRKLYSLTDSFEEELLAQLEEYERMLLDFQKELELTRTRHSLAVGAITSLHRQIDFQESQLRKVNMENEMLKRELRERKQQLQAMSDKFSNLREDKKHLEMMGLIERENLILRQKVVNLERDMVERNLAISQLDSRVAELQAQVDQSQDHLQRRKQLQEDLQLRNEMTQQAEQQARVALESAQSRLERLRNKVIQAAFSASGTKATTEISDNSILETLQKIISERNEFYNQLKQKGVKVPPLQPSDSSLPTKVKKVTSK
ncbi:coiled-coil domain-containing protein 27-like [Perognathus longimembris pacificus]|uniref:coiled-coil domain-containing protein 27-like n=1 Tax=Perognathus longimembris pacificus TaxID=214514 RepID=UPI00201978F5|nr:coiled-coil domain-containing protein 27-like [Perognathus longimembris pacificus]